MSCCSRRDFISLTSSTVLGAAVLGGVKNSIASEGDGKAASAGPGSKYIPSVKAVFVRRKGEYGMRWPGQIYDGKAAMENYTRRIKAEGEKLGIDVDLKPVPIYSPVEADWWIAEAKSRKPDGLLVVLLDRQEHAWPTAAKAVDTGIPTVIFSPVGTAFTTNTVKLAHREGVFFCSTDDFRQVIYGMKMLKAGAKLREMRFIILKGNKRREDQIDLLGTKLRYLPAKSFLEEYNRIPFTAEIRRIAEEYIKRSVKIYGASEQDVLNGVKSFVVSRNILEREEGDGISMDCLGALGKSTVSLPCISWSRMNDCGVPAACEADLEACATHALVQYLFDRPGFQQDPVPETARNALIGAHCCCPTRLNGFSKSPEPYSIRYHHGKRDATPVPVWKIGQRMTSVDVLLRGKKPEMIISTGKVIENVSVPPAGGCVVSVMVKLNGVENLLDYPGFHQLFFYGDYKRELIQYCQLFGITPRVV